MPAATHELVFQLVYVASGVLSTVLRQFLVYQGAGDQRTMLLPIMHYMGMVLVGLVPARVLLSRTSHDATDPKAGPANASRKTSVDAAEENGEERSASAASGHSLLELLTWAGSACEFFGSILCCVGLAMVGSGLYQVLYSSAVCWAALLSRIFLRRRLSKWQWMSLGVIMLGLVLSTSDHWGLSSHGGELPMAPVPARAHGVEAATRGLRAVQPPAGAASEAIVAEAIAGEAGSRLHIVSHALDALRPAHGAPVAAAPADDADSGCRVLIGMLITLLGAACYGANYVVGEKLMLLPQRPSPMALSSRIGQTCAGILALYMLGVTLPRWEELVEENMARNHADTALVACAFAALLLCHMANALTHFLMLGSAGAVKTGIQQSIRAICVFAVSSVAFCDVHSVQCFTSSRALATTVVVSGVLCYAVASDRAKSAKAAATTPKATEMRTFPRPVSESP